MREYVDFEFINNPLSVSTPIDNVDSLGVREVYDTKEIKKKISVIKKERSKDLGTTDFNLISNILKTLEDKGEIDAFVEIVQYCNSIRDQREKDGRLVPSSIDRMQKNALENIACELAVSSDIEYGVALMDVASIMGIKTSNLT